MSCYCKQARIYNNTVSKTKQPSAGVATRELLCNARAVLKERNATQFHVDTKMIQDQPVLVFADNGIGMYPNTFDFLDYKRKNSDGMYSAWGEGMKDTIHHFISEDPRSIAYVYTWNGEGSDKCADVACLKTSDNTGVLTYFGYAGICLAMSTERNAAKIEKNYIDKGDKDPLVLEHDNPLAPFVNVSEVIDHLRQYADSEDHGTVIEIWHPRVHMNEEGDLLCTEKGETVYEFIKNSMIPQCPKQQLFVCNWLQDMTIRIQGKKVKFLSWKTTDFVSEVISVSNLDGDEIARMIIKREENVDNLKRDSFTEKLCRTGDPVEGKFTFMLSDMIVEDCKYTFVHDFKRRIEGFPSYLFLYKYDNTLVGRSHDIYKALSLQISDDEVTYDESGVPRHTMTDQIITFERLLEGLQEARVMSYAKFGHEGKGQPTAEAPIERFFQRFCLLPYRAFLAPNNTSEIYERMKTSVDIKNNPFLMHRVKFQIGKWAASYLPDLGVQAPVLPEQPSPAPMMRDQAGDHDDDVLDQHAAPSMSVSARHLHVNDSTSPAALQSLETQDRAGSSQILHDARQLQESVEGCEDANQEVAQTKETTEDDYNRAKRTRRVPKRKTVDQGDNKQRKKSSTKRPSFTILLDRFKAIARVGEDKHMDHFDEFRTIKEHSILIRDLLELGEINEAARLCEVTQT